MVSPFMADAEKLAAVREALPSLSAGIQLDAATAGPLPAEVAAAMTQLETYERDIGRADAGHREEQGQRLEEARAAVAAVVSGGLDEVILSHGATEALAVALDDLAPATHGASRALLTSETSGAIRSAVGAWSARTGGEIASTEAPADLDDDGLLDRLDGRLGGPAAGRPGTQLLVVPHVSPTTGRVLPVGKIVELARARGARVLVDGAQAVGAIPVDAPALDADAYAISGHRWLLGPEGIGGLWRRDAAPGTRVDRFDAAIDRRDGRSRLHPPTVVGLARAIGWLSMFVGLDFVHRRGDAMARDAASRLAAIEGVQLMTPARPLATIVTFRLRGWPAQRALDELAARTFLIARAIPSIDAIRLSPGCWTTTEELERVAEVVTLLARHTPETLPPRRTLAMLGQP